MTKIACGVFSAKRPEVSGVARMAAKRGLFMGFSLRRIDRMALLRVTRLFCHFCKVSRFKAWCEKRFVIVIAL